MRAAWVRATDPAASAGLSPVNTLFDLKPPPPPLLSSRATVAIPTGPDDGMENDVDRLDIARPPPALPPIAASRVGRVAEAASEEENAGGDKRYSRGANAPDSLNALLQTCGGEREGKGAS